MTSLVLLQQKLSPPQAGAMHIARTDLLQRMNTVPPVLLIVAPAGFGKTTLALQFVQQNARPAAWIRFDSQDNLLHAFVSHLVAGLRQILPDIGASTLLRLQQDSGADTETLLRELIGSLEQALPQMTRSHYVLVLDDLHEIHNSEILAGLNLLLDYLPTALQLVITSRSTPDLKILLRTGRGQVATIGIDDLRFNRNECERYLANLLGRMLPAAEIDRVVHITQGWAVALHFFALAFQRGALRDLDSRLQTGREQMMQYLFEELFATTSPLQQAFMLMTAPLDMLTDELCQYVTGQNDSAEQLKNMAQLQILTQSAGGYHYHALVREMLQARLAHDQPLWRTAMQRGAQWYQENGALPQAVDAWIALRDWQAARKLIETGGHNCLQRGERLQLMQWIDALPANFVNQSEKLLCLRVWAFNDAEKFVVGEALLDRAEALISQGPPPDLHDQQTLLCEIFSLRAIISRLRMDGVAAIHYSQRALQYADGAVFPLRWRSYLTLGSHEYIIGEFDSAEAKLIQAVAFAKADGHLYAVAQCAGYLALCIAQKAQLRRARAVLNDAIVWLEQRLFDRLPAGCWRNIGLVEYHRECGEFDQAWHYLRPLLQFRYDPACELMQHLIILLLWYGLSMSARQYDETRQALNALMMLDQELHFEWLFAFGSLGALQARYAQHTGDLAGASEWVLANRDALLRHESFVANIDRLMALSICNQSNELALSQEFLVRVQQTGCFAQQRKLHIGYLVQQSIWTAKTDRLDSAAELLDSALVLGGDEGFVQLYLDEGAAITPLLGHCKHPRAQQLLQKSHSGVQQQVLVSLRELDVLRQVCDGLSDKEISRRLAITPGTVKTHLRNIYRKLGVKRRTQAISRAKALHLIDG